jgi:hypothetical protein
VCAWVDPAFDEFSGRNPSHLLIFNRGRLDDADDG